MEISIRLTAGIPVQEERILKLELQIFINRLHQVLCAQTIHDRETVMRRRRPAETTRLHRAHKTALRDIPGKVLTLSKDRRQVSESIRRVKES